MSARRKNARRRKHEGVQLMIGTTAEKQIAEQEAVTASQDRADIRASIDRAQAASLRRQLSPDLRAKLDKTWADFRKKLDKLKAVTAGEHKRNLLSYRDEDQKICAGYDKARKKLEQELDHERERIVRQHRDVDEAAA